MSWTKNILTLVFSLLFIFIISEFLFRIFDIGYGNAPLERSKLYHHEHPKEYSFTIHQPKGEYGGHKIFYDKYGYRTSNHHVGNFKERDDENSIIFLGDSYTEANQVSYENTFVNKIGRILKVNTLNLGVSSYSPAIYLVQTKRQLHLLKSKLVIMQIFRNDFDNDVKYLTKAIFKDDELFGIDGGNKNIYVSILRKSYLVRFLRKSQLLIVELFKKRNFSNKNLNFTYIDDIKNENLIQTTKIILEIKKELNKSDKKLLVFMMPSKTLSKVRKCCESDTVYNKFKTQMKNRNINFLDISKYFSNHSNQEDLFFDVDIHLTEKGHEILANGLINEMNKFISIE